MAVKVVGVLEGGVLMVNEVNDTVIGRTGRRGDDEDGIETCRDKIVRPTERPVLDGGNDCSSERVKTAKDGMYRNVGGPR